MHPAWDGVVETQTDFYTGNADCLHHPPTKKMAWWYAECCHTHKDNYTCMQRCIIAIRLMPTKPGRARSGRQAAWFGYGMSPRAWSPLAMFPGSEERRSARPSDGEAVRRAGALCLTRTSRPCNRRNPRAMPPALPARSCHPMCSLTSAASTRGVPLPSPPHTPCSLAARAICGRARGEHTHARRRPRPNKCAYANIFASGGHVQFL